LNGRYFRGQIDDARLYDYALDPSEISPLVNTPPMLPAISERSMIAGATLTITNVASDAESPPQSLTYSLLSPVNGATLNSSNGIFVWRPLIVQGGATNQFSIKVTDNGLPNLAATQSFRVVVNSAAIPVLSKPILIQGQLQTLIYGDPGPDYIIQSSSNLVQWTPLLNTNPAVLPFLFIEPGPTNPARFYRVRLAP